MWSLSINILTYAKTELVCIVILLILLYKSVKGIDTRYTWRLFVQMIVAALIFVSCYALSNLADVGVLRISRNLNYIFNILYFSFNSIASYLWFLYSENVQEEKYIQSKRSRLLCFIPAVVSIALSVLSWKTHWLFYIDGNNCYQRGPYFILQYVFPYLYILVTTGKAFWKSCRKENYAKKREYRTLGVFIVMPILLAALQFVSLQTLTISTGTTIAILLIYLNSQEILISQDPLTGLNNRSQLIRNLSQRMKNTAKNRRLYLIIMDMNHFKKINDRYGHVEGDNALVRAAQVLKKVGKEHDCFISRYGGDEFILLCEAAEKEEIENLCRDVNQELHKIKEKTKAPYELDASFGYAEYTDGIEAIPDFIKAADIELYKQKQTR